MSIAARWLRVVGEVPVGEVIDVKLPPMYSTPCSITWALTEPLAAPHVLSAGVVPGAADAGNPTIRTATATAVLARKRNR